MHTKIALITGVGREVGIAAGARVWAMPADLAEPSGIERLFAQIAHEAGPQRGMVLSHCESVDSAILDTSLDSFERHFAVNARASWQLIAAFARQAGDDGGAIVALTSDHTAFNLPYGASKGALDRIVIAAARELGGQHISANVLNPGPVDTGWMDDAVRAELTALQPGGRWINGQLIKADGGFSA